jgi:hypothetical protein
VDCLEDVLAADRQARALACSWLEQAGR